MPNTKKKPAAKPVKPAAKAKAPAKPAAKAKAPAKPVAKAKAPAKAPVKRAPDTKVVERVDHSTDSTIRTSGTSIKRSRSAENWRTSGLVGESGVLGGQHMGGHSDVGGAIEMGGGGLGINEFNK
jgi:hypothetical protein